jgi:1,4-alpha-glucan branching enzyme
MVYAYSEKFVLVLSHDEVVHKKGSMIEKMPGGYEDKFSNLRLAYGFMMTHPGKKLLFMGQEFAQFKEFNESDELDWGIFEFDAHTCIRDYVKALNHLYQEEPALYELDDDPDGFEWINSTDSNDSVLAYARKTKKKEDTLLIVCNFSTNEYKDFQMGVPYAGKYKEIFTSEEARFGGDGKKNKTMKTSKKDECDGREDSIHASIAPLSISVFKYHK